MKTIITYRIRVNQINQELRILLLHCSKSIVIQNHQHSTRITHWINDNKTWKLNGPSKDDFKFLVLRGKTEKEKGNIKQRRSATIKKTLTPHPPSSPSPLSPLTRTILVFTGIYLRVYRSISWKRERRP